MDAAAIQLAQAIAALGATGILALFGYLWITGKIHSHSEKAEWDERLAQSQSETAAALLYREELRKEALADRRAADERVTKLADVVRESNDLTRRSLDLNERLFDEFVRASTSRTRKSDGPSVQR